MKTYKELLETLEAADPKSLWMNPPTGSVDCAESWICDIENSLKEDEEEGIEDADIPEKEFIEVEKNSPDDDDYDEEYGEYRPI